MSIKVSYSKIKKYLECPRLYWELYCNEWATRAISEYGPFRDIGNLMHEVLRVLASRRIAGRSQDRVTRKEGLAVLDMLLKKQDEARWKTPVRATYEVVEAVQNMITQSWKQLDFRYTIDTERPFSINIGTIEGPPGKPPLRNVVITGIIDRLDQKPNGTIKLIDYKTGMTFMSFSKFEKDDQARIYLKAGALAFPDAPRVEIEFQYIAKGVKLGPIKYDHESAQAHTSTMNAVIWRMHNWKEFPETSGAPHCMSCHRRGECRSYQEMLGGELNTFARGAADNLAQYQQMKAINKGSEEAKKRFKTWINNECEKDPEGEVFGGGYKGGITFRNQTGYGSLKDLATTVAKTIVEQHDGEFPLPDLPDVLFSLTDEQKQAVAGVLGDLVAQNALVRTAFDVACASGKAMSMRVNNFFNSLPIGELRDAVGKAIEMESRNEGYYIVEVEEMTDVFYSPEPSESEVAEAKRQNKRDALLDAVLPPEPKKDSGFSDCKACGGHGHNSRGNACTPCQLRKDAGEVPLALESVTAVAETIDPDDPFGFGS